jgi:uncharacterized protein (TIGR02118 family)
MIKLVVMYPWPADPNHFREHYIKHHLPLCQAIPGVLRSRFAFEPRTLQGASRWFCIYEAEYPNEEVLHMALASSEGRAAAADVMNYSPDAPTGLICEIVEC